MDASIPVFPLLDVHREVLELRLGGIWRHFHLGQAPALAKALANATGAPRWNPTTGTLTVRTPLIGETAGQARIFSLVEFSPAPPSATLIG